MSDEQVEYVDEVGGLMFRAIRLVNIGDSVPQHVHDYDHVSLIACGAVRLYVDGVFQEDIRGFKPVLIKANRQHLFEALEPNTLPSCVHQLNGQQYTLTKGN